MALLIENSKIEQLISQFANELVEAETLIRYHDEYREAITEILDGSTFLELALALEEIVNWAPSSDPAVEPLTNLHSALNEWICRERTIQRCATDWEWKKLIEYTNRKVDVLVHLEALPELVQLFNHDEAYRFEALVMNTINKATALSL